jgi:hypothetical protein
MTKVREEPQAGILLLMNWNQEGVLDSEGGHAQRGRKQKAFELKRFISEYGAMQQTQEFKRKQFGKTQAEANQATD